MGGGGLFQLRDQLAPVPAADRLLSDATAAAARVRAPEVRALFAEVSTAIYRLTRRAGELDRRATESGMASSETDLIRRTLRAAPALLKRLERLAERLDGLDAALEGTTEGELMTSIARLERAAAAPGADRPALAAAGRDLEATLQRREATELERARFSAKLCELLGWLRNAYQRAQQLETEDDRGASDLESASAELDAFLAASASSLGAKPRWRSVRGAGRARRGVEAGLGPAAAEQQRLVFAVQLALPGGELAVGLGQLAARRPRGRRRRRPARDRPAPARDRGRGRRSARGSGATCRKPWPTATTPSWSLALYDSTPGRAPSSAARGRAGRPARRARPARSPPRRRCRRARPGRGDGSRRVERASPAAHRR